MYSVLKKSCLELLVQLMAKKVLDKIFPLASKGVSVCCGVWCVCVLVANEVRI